MATRLKYLIAFVATLFVLSTLPALGADLPLVKIFSTGGTIASKYDAAKGGFLPALKGSDLIEAIPAIKDVARIDVEDVSNIGSADMTPEIWVKISKRMNEVLADPTVTGLVITHGTDTLEETAYFMDLTVTSQKPVILVGAQRAASMPDSDGPRNLLNAIRVAVSPEAIGKGAMIVMNGQINAAREVTKTNTIEGETFRSLEFGQLGYADAEKVRFYRAPLRRQTIALDPEAKLGRIEIVLHYAGNDGNVIRSLLKTGGLDGLVIAGTGLGHISGLAFDAVQEARNQNLPVVISTRVYTGRVMPLYAAKGRALSTKKIGCILGDNLSPQKARVLLMLALTKTKDPEQLQKYFDY